MARACSSQNGNLRVSKHFCLVSSNEVRTISLERVKTILMRISIILLLLILASCGEHVEGTKPVSYISKSESAGRHRNVVTIKHDECWFVVANAHNTISIIHHPKCPNHTKPF